MTTDGHGSANDPKDSEFQLAPETPPENPRAEEALKDIPGIFDSYSEQSPQQQQDQFQPADPFAEQSPDPFQDPQFQDQPGFEPQSELQSGYEPSGSFDAPPQDDGMGEPAPGFDPGLDPGFEAAPGFEAPQEIEAGPAVDHLPPAVATASETLNQIREFSEKASAPKTAVPAAYPFSLLITGKLDIYEKEKLLDLLSRENMGIREVDLEPQFEAGRILIPRISEYAGVLLVQALRGTSAQIRLAPSDQVFATEDTREPVSSAAGPQDTRAELSPDPSHSADLLPIVPGATLASIQVPIVLDTIVVSASLRTAVVEAERSSEFQETLDSLQRELRYKAFRRGAQAILNFQIQLTPLRLPAHYKLVVSGTAVRDGSQDTYVAPDPLPYN